MKRAIFLAAATALLAGCDSPASHDQPTRPRLVTVCRRQVGDLYIDAAGQRWLGIPDMPDLWVRVAASAQTRDVCI
jgi:hypothetical protein